MSLQRMIADLAELSEAEKENTALRRLLWLRHGCSVAGLYGDDGEMQCGVCMIDFKRDPVDVIERQWLNAARRAALVDAENTELASDD